MRMDNFSFEFVNRLAGFYGCRTRQTARTVAARLNKVSQVGIGLGKYFTAHVRIIAYFAFNKYQTKQEML